MKKFLSLLLCLVLLTVSLASLTSCGKQVTIAVPNDPTNEARALKLLEVQGIITLNETADGALATVRDIKDNPYNVKFVEIEAAQLPLKLKDVDYAVINSNYAIEAKLTPFVTEGTDVSYPNILTVKAGNETSAKTLALIAALKSAQVSAFIDGSYAGAIVNDLLLDGGALTNGYDDAVDYDALAGTTIKVGATPVPHADILEKAKEVLAVKNITLDIVIFTDYVQPNTAVENGDLDANFFQHIPYMNDFNAENGTHLVSVLKIHHEPMGVYSANHANFDDIKK